MFESTHSPNLMIDGVTEMWPLTDHVFPMLERVNLLDPSARIFLMDRPHKISIHNETGETNTDNNTLVSHSIDSVWQPVDADTLASLSSQTQTHQEVKSIII